MNPLFKRGGHDLLRFLVRNQKQGKKTEIIFAERKSQENSSINELKLKLLDEIQIIQTQQKLLDLGIKLLAERQEYEENRLQITLKKKYELYFFDTNYLVTYVIICISE